MAALCLPFSDGAIQPGESALGAVLRWAENNDIEGVYRLMCLVGHGGASGLTLRSFADALPTLARSLAVPEADLRAGAFVPDSGVRRAWVRAFGGQRLSPAMVLHRRARICPACLREGSPLLQIWELVLVSECTRHGVQLLASCPECGARLDWQRARVSFCRKCPVDFSEVAAVPSDPAVLALVREIERRAHGCEAPSVALAAMGASDRQLQAFMEACLVFGREVQTRLWRERAGFEPTGVDDVRRVLKAAASVLLGDWRTNYHAFLSRMIGSARAAGASDWKDLVGGHYALLYQRWKSGCSQAVRHSFQDFLVAAQPELLLYAPRRINAACGVKDAVYLTLSVVAARLGVNHAKVLAAANAIGIEVARVEDRAGRVVQRVPHAAFDQIRDYLRANPGPWLGRRWTTQSGKWLITAGRTRGLGREAAATVTKFASGRDFPSADLIGVFPVEAHLATALVARRLGVTGDRMRHVIKSGFFRRFGPREETGEAVSATAYCAFERALARAVVPPPAERRGVVPFKRAVKDKLRRFYMGYVDLLAAILAGDVGPCYVTPTGRGLARLLVDRAAVDALVVARKARAKGTGLGTAEAARHLGCSMNAIWLLTKARVLRPRRVTISGRKAYLFERRDLDRFAKRYVLLTEVARTGLLPGVAGAWPAAHAVLEAHRVRPSHVIPSYDGRILIYRRSDVERLARRMAKRRHGREPSCPNTNCASHGRSVHAFRLLYWAHGRTKTGTKVWRCRACRRCFLERRNGTRVAESTRGIKTIRLRAPETSVRRGVRISTHRPKDPAAAPAGLAARPRPRSRRHRVFTGGGA